LKNNRPDIPISKFFIQSVVKGDLKILKMWFKVLQVKHFLLHRLVSYEFYKKIFTTQISNKRYLVGSESFLQNSKPNCYNCNIPAHLEN